MLVFLFFAPVPERGFGVFVSLLQKFLVFGHRQSALSSAFAPALFGQSEAFPNVGAGGFLVSGVVVEPEEVECGVRYFVIIRKSDFGEREVSAPIGVIADEHIVGIHGNLRV